MNRFAAFLMLLLGSAAAVSAATPKVRRGAVSNSVLCLILQAHEMGDYGHRDYLTCDLIIEKEGVVAFGLTIELPDRVAKKHQDALNRGEWFVSIAGATVDEKYIEGHGTIRTGVTVPIGSSITTVTPREGRMAMLAAKGVRRELQTPSDHNRQLQTTYGTHTVLVLRVSVSDSSPSFSTSALADDFFGNGFSVIKRFSDCSFGGIQFKAYDLSNPVVDVVIQGRASSFTSSNLWPLAMAAGASQKNVNYLTDIAQHVAIVLPPGLSDSGWYASGSVGGWWSLYNDQWGGFPNFGVHELGHNLGMGHAGVGGDPYADSSDVMGYGDTQQYGISKCFNGYHYWYLNWFASRSISVDPYTHNVLTLAAFAHYDRTNENQFVVINVDSYYLVCTEANMLFLLLHVKVTVAQSQPGIFSTRLAALDNSGSFQVANFGGSSSPLIIKVCSIVNGGAVDYAVVSIGVGVSDCNGGIANTQNTQSPSTSPVAVSAPPPKAPPVAAPTAPPTQDPTVQPSQAPVDSPTPAPVSGRPTKAPVAGPTNPPVPATSKPTLAGRRRRPTQSPALRVVAPTTRAPR